MKNTKYCANDGAELREDNTCSKCNRRVSDYWEKELASRNPEGNQWINEEWCKNYKYDYMNTYLGMYHMCHNCKYFMFHSLTYCPTCANKLVSEKMYKRELLEKYADYKQGY